MTDVRHQLHRRQAGAGGAASTAPRPPTWACGCRTWRARCNVLVGGQQATTYYEGGEQYEVHVRAAEAARHDAAGISSQIEVPSASSGRCTARRPGHASPKRAAARRQSTAQPPAAGAWSWRTCSPASRRRRSSTRSTGQAAELKMPEGYSYGFTGRSKEQGKAGANFAARLPAVDRLHVPDPGGAVRELAPPDHHPAGAAADRAVRAAVADASDRVAQHLLGPRHPGAVRHREEELRSCRSTTPTSCASAAWPARDRRSARPTATACGRS